MIGVELFAGAGGMSLGAARAGIDVRVAVESHHAACETYATNHPKTRLIRGDIQNVDWRSLELDTNEDLIVFGGPPCQGFSTSNQRSRNRDNPRNWLFLEFMRAVAELSPAFVVFENVAGILQTERGEFVRRLENSFQELGYSSSAAILNAIDFGVPQSRSRYFLVASKSKHPLEITVPPASEQPPTVMEAIEDLPELFNGNAKDELPYKKPAGSSYAKNLRGKATVCTGNLVTENAAYVLERYRHVPPGGNWRDIPESLMSNYADRRRCHTGIYRRLDGNAQSVVLGNFRKNMLIHPTHHRGLSVREAARLQSFPDEFHFRGSIGLQQQQVGNAVPPLLSQGVFKNLLSRIGR